MINYPITDLQYKNAYDAVKRAINKFSINTFDLGVCLKAYPMVWGDPEKYKDNIILIEMFHCAGVNMKGIGKRYCCGSG